MNPTKKLKIILASQSPRRLQLLLDEGFDVVTFPSHILEVPLSSESPSDYVLRLAKEKAAASLKALPFDLKTADFLLAADTTVALGRELFEKPNNFDEAKTMLNKLSGNTHSVFTAYCLYNFKSQTEITQCVETKVTFKNLSNEEIEAYLHTNDWKDKAGSYGIQSIKHLFILKVEGSIFNVMGLPVEAVLKHLI